MAFDFFGRGWILKKWNVPKYGILKADFVIKRAVAQDKKSLKLAIEYTIHNLKVRFPDMKIEASHKFSLFSRSVEIKGVSEKDNRIFSIKLTPKKIFVKVYGLDYEDVLECIA
ncbi:MAG: hypothetical protein QW622_03500 [Candidatus Pacearchaeota archaeon]